MQGTKRYLILFWTLAWWKPLLPSDYKMLLLVKAWRRRWNCTLLNRNSDERHRRLSKRPLKSELSSGDTLDMSEFSPRIDVVVILRTNWVVIVFYYSRDVDIFWPFMLQVIKVSRHTGWTKENKFSYGAPNVDGPECHSDGMMFGTRLFWMAFESWIILLVHLSMLIVNSKLVWKTCLRVH